MRVENKRHTSATSVAHFAFITEVLCVWLERYALRGETCVSLGPTMVSRIKTFAQGRRWLILLPPLAALFSCPPSSVASIPLACPRRASAFQGSPRDGSRR